MVAKTKKILFIVAAAVVSVGIMVGIFFGSASVLGIKFGGTTPGKTGGAVRETQFAFTGKTTIADKEYNVTVYGYKDDDKSVSVRIKELPTAELGGNWAFVEGKGYKLYFDDTNSTVAYTKYDTATQSYSFDYRLNIGDTNGGSGKVSFTYKDEAFASSYDGIGLGYAPPQFNGHSSYVGAVFALHESVKCVLTCYEDGTCTSVSTNEVKFASPRNGTWSYDAATNQYTFTFEDEPFAVNTTDGSSYWEFKGEVGASMDEAAAHWNVFDPATSWWVSRKVTDPSEFTNTYKTVYDEETNTYYLCFEHGFAGFGEFADRYVSWCPDEV